jgi:hypothetical protein
MNRNSARSCLLVCACLIRFEYAIAQETPDPWYGRQLKPTNIDKPKFFTDSFSIELPKGWQVVSGHTGTLFSVVEKTRQSEGGALITLHYQRLFAPLEEELMAGASERELKQLEARELSGKGFTSQVKNGPSGPFIVVHYDRPGLSGKDDHVVQYAIPVGTTLYRLICIAPAGAPTSPEHDGHAEKYRPIFAHVAASFAPVGSGSK